jgi:hypothetical protein
VRFAEAFDPNPIMRAKGVVEFSDLSPEVLPRLAIRVSGFLLVRRPRGFKSNVRSTRDLQVPSSRTPLVAERGSGFQATRAWGVRNVGFLPASMQARDPCRGSKREQRRGLGKLRLTSLYHCP